jgi:hypothetical protein
MDKNIRQDLIRGFLLLIQRLYLIHIKKLPKESQIYFIFFEGLSLKKPVLAIPIT